jgi:hypothetical protein
MTHPAMQRRQFITAIGALGATAAAGIQPRLNAAPDAPKPADDGPLLAGTPAVFAPSPSGFTVTLPVRRAAAAWVEYGETKDLGLRAGCDPFGFVPQDDTAVKIRVSGLKPGTRYHWRATLRPNGDLDPAAEIRTDTYTAKTLDPAAASTRFSVWNDTHDQAATIQSLFDLRNAKDDFLLWNGDLSNNVNDPALLPGLYVSPKKVDLAKGPPILLTQGNHDLRGLHARGLHRYVDFPGGRSFYAFRSGPVAFVALDTGEDKPDTHPSFKGVPASEPLIAEQARWLAKIITLPGFRDAPYRVVFCHIPLRWTNEGPQNYAKKGYDRVSLRGRAAWHDTLVRWGAHIIISGHVHRAGLLAPDARFPYAQLLGGGPGRSADDHPTIITGDADARQFRITCTDVEDNGTLHDLVLKPLA